MPLSVDSDPLSPPIRDTVDAVPDDDAEPPAIVSISDIHGYLEETRDALLTLRDHPDFEPVVTADSDGTLHWADENYVLVFNGDLVDRGPDNDGVLQLVGRLIDEAPPGRVRVTLGNHEWMILMPKKYRGIGWYSTERSTDERRTYLQRIADGHVIAAYDGYNVTYAHAGSPDPYVVNTVNDSLVDAAAELEEAIGTIEDGTTQTRVRQEYPQVLGTGTPAKGPDAGLVWIDFSHLPSDGPPQVVGHTRHSNPQTKGDIYCQDILQDNLQSDGGHGVFVETPESLSAVLREPNQSVTAESLA